MSLWLNAVQFSVVVGGCDGADVVGGVVDDVVVVIVVVVVVGVVDVVVLVVVVVVIVVVVVVGVVEGSGDQTPPPPENPSISYPKRHGIRRSLIWACYSHSKMSSKSNIFALFQQIQRNATICALKRKSVCNFLRRPAPDPQILPPL